jgi:Zn-dependent protease with chaperone function
VRFVARTPREGINVSDEHPLVEAATLTFGLAGVLIAIAAFIVFFVDIVVSFVSPQTEADLFADWDFARFISSDVAAAPEVQSLARRLQRHWPDSPYQFSVSIIDEPRLNAFALPGGTILVTRGLIDAVDSENELAFVLAHEIGHFRNRDHLRQLGRGFAFGLVLLAVAGTDGGFATSSVLDGAARSFGRRQVFRKLGRIPGVSPISTSPPPIRQCPIRRRPCDETFHRVLEMLEEQRPPLASVH